MRALLMVVTKNKRSIFPRAGAPDGNSDAGLGIVVTAEFEHAANVTATSEATILRMIVIEMPS